MIKSWLLCLRGVLHRLSRGLALEHMELDRGHMSTCLHIYMTSQV